MIGDSVMSADLSLRHFYLTLSYFNSNLSRSLKLVADFIDFAANLDILIIKMSISI